MPKYTFKCKKCGDDKQVFASRKRTCTPCKKCGEYMYRQMPVLSGPAQVTETVDKYTGKKWIDDQDVILKDRQGAHYWKNEVPRLVNSGTYSLETMLEMNWVYFDDKDELQTRTKQPSQE